MRKLGKAALLLLAAVVLFSCTKEYDDSELRGRIENLETWQKTVNSQIIALQGLVTALENKDHITSVTELADKSGYTITFSQSSPITIKHGQKGANGATPVIGIKQDTDGKYYWTLDGEYLTDGGKKIPTTGDNGETGEAGINAVAPQVRINAATNIWEISIDGGANWTSTGVKAKGDKGEQGDAIFAADGIDYTSDPDNVTFTLADGTTTITLPRTNNITVAFESYEIVTVIPGIGCPDINVIMPDAATYTSVIAKIQSNGGTGTDIKTKASASAWSAKIIKGAENKVSIRVTPADDAQMGDVAILTVSVVTKTGALISASRTLKFESDPIEPSGDTYTITSLSQLGWVLGQINNTANFSVGKTFELSSDLDLSGCKWKPIGAQDDGGHRQFSGTFNGNGHTIKGVSIERNSNLYVGFFSYVAATGTIKDLHLEGTISNTMHIEDLSKSSFTGSIAGVNKGAVVNCSFKGNVSSYNPFHAGGVVGINQDGLVAGCSYIDSEGAMVRANGQNGSYSMSGGIVGYNIAFGKNSYVLGCFNTGKVSSVGRAGGIVGENFGSAATYGAIVVGCYNQGYVKSDNSDSEGGGIAAVIGDNTEIHACYNTGRIDCVNPRNSGAIMGYDVFYKSTDLLNTNYWLTGSAAQGYSNLPENQVVDCVAKSEAKLNSQETVDALNAAIGKWNTANGNLCNYKFVIGAQYPVLVKK